MFLKVKENPVTLTKKIVNKKEHVDHRYDVDLGLDQTHFLEFKSFSLYSSCSENISDKLPGQMQVQIPRFEFCPILSASSIDWGSLLPTVSGKKSAKKPPITADTPRINMGADPPSSPMSRAKMAPILATVLQLPMAVLRIVVGKSSAA